jgi:hypothetical protein
LKRTRKSGRFGTLLFLAPTAAIMLIVLIGLVSNEASTTGVLVVEALSSGKYSPAVPLQVSATVGTVTHLTPFNITVGAGEQTVVFGTLSWYLAPAPKSVVVVGGKTAYAVGIYFPIVRVITFNRDGFNSTAVTALHGVTPVVWINDGTVGVTLVITPNTRVYLQPSQNYTMVFKSAGTYGFSIFNTDFGGSVTCE